MIKFATPFNLISKPDRRQNPDRRSAWRGSRRMSDIRAFGEQPLTIDPDAEWASESESSPDDDRGVKVAKYVH